MVWCPRKYRASSAPAPMVTASLGCVSVSMWVVHQNSPAGVVVYADSTHLSTEFTLAMSPHIRELILDNA